MSAVHLRSAVCLLGRFPALAGADLEVAEREVVLLSGPNGAGKTTLLRLLAGLEALYAGEATVLGADLAVDRRGVRRHVAYVGHDTGCYDDLTVRENARFFARAAGVGARRGDDALERLGLSGLAGVAHGRCSAGQRRRLAIAIALVGTPRLLLLDEPHAGLDPDARTLVDRLIETAPDDGCTVVFASHELDRARRLADREVMMRGGRAYSAAPADPTARADADGGVVVRP